MAGMEEERMDDGAPSPQAGSAQTASALPPGDLPRRLDPQRKWGLVAVGILAAGILAFILLNVLAPRPSQVERPSRAPLVQVEPLVVTDGPLPVRGFGPVRPRAQVTLIAQVSGKVTETSPALVTGGTFKKGDMLLRIDSRTYAAALDQTEAERAARRADLAFAERQLERDQELAQSGAASERRRDETLNQRDRARAQIAALDAQIAARAVDLENTVITAPFDGRVFSESVDVGSVVQPGVEVARVYAHDVSEIVVSLSDREAALIPGIWDEELTDPPKATVTLVYRGHTYAWDGFVHRVEAGIDPDTRTIDVVVRVPEPTRRGRRIDLEGIDTLEDAPPLISGTYAAVEIEGLALSYALIPRAALRNDASIWIVGAGERLERIAVDLVQDQGNVVAVRSPDLEDGARLIVSELPVATPGLEVRATDDAPGTP
jgi:RND family efflux transporter MFP subunit